MIVVLYLFVISFAVLTVYYTIVFRKLAFYNNGKRSISKYFPVSVIICAHNEAANLKSNLPHILQQDYPNFEVIVINDRSTDNSEEILAGLKEKHDHLRVIHHSGKRKYKGKKDALSHGISLAKHDHLLLTDADCRPAGNQWIASMVSAFENKDIVLGYAPFYEGRGMLNRFIRFDNFYTALQYLSFSLMGVTYMGVGRNIAYRKNVQRTSNTFESHKHLLSGDDDLLINAMATRNNATIMIDPGTFVYSEPKNSLSGWLHQKRRHVSTGFHYKPGHQLMLGTLSFSQIMFNITFLTLLINGFWMPFVMTFFVVKNLLQLMTFKKIMDKLQVRDLLIFTPFHDFMMSLLFITLGSLSFIKTKEWK